MPHLLIIAAIALSILAYFFHGEPKLFDILITALGSLLVAIGLVLGQNASAAQASVSYTITTVGGCLIALALYDAIDLFRRR